MKRLSTTRRHCASVMLAGMLSAVLLSSSCASRRYSSLTAVRSDSLSASVTERTDYAPVPKRTAALKVSAAQWLQLRDLPEGFGLAVQNGGMSLSLTSDGEGGVNVTAEADSTGRKVRYRREETTSLARDETLGEEEQRREPPRWRHLIPALAIALAAAAILKRKGSSS